MLSEPTATLMYAEAGEAVDAVARMASATAGALDALAARLRSDRPTIAFTCARGSSDHAAAYAKFLIESRLGLPVVSQPPSLASIYGGNVQSVRGAPFFAISQSGRSPDLILSAKAARDRGAIVIALVNDAESPLAREADVILPVAAGPETSVAATKSFIATLALIARLVARWADDRRLMSELDGFPLTLAAAWQADWTDVVPDLVDARSVFVLGRGSTLGIAQEAALKLKETSGIHAEAFSVAEVVHGPMAIVDDGFPVLVLPPADADRSTLAPMLATLAKAGARLLIAGEDRMPVPPDVDPVLAPIAMIQSFYRLTNALAVARGRDPDRPPLLSKVTRTL